MLPRGVGRQRAQLVTPTCGASLFLTCRFTVLGNRADAIGNFTICRAFNLPPTIAAPEILEIWR